MKHLLSAALPATLVGLLMVLIAGTAGAQTTSPIQGKSNPVVARGGFDDDGDGILNCQDPDYVPAKDGTGKQLGRAHGLTNTSTNGGFGPGDGTGNKGARPLDGTGFGKTQGVGASSLGVCDGTGPKGKCRGR